MGRPKGSKNKLTLLRDTIKENAETELLSGFMEVVAATLALAKEGDPTALKIVWDRILPSKRAIEEVTGKEDKLSINISIEGMAVDHAAVGGGVIEQSNVEDAQFEEITIDVPDK